ncbi:MAG: glycosyltransferase family 4 protein [Acidobacteria bacterium]|nr:glycosyltransferase family 4 protein [Acidobacteriota bacterium]
MKVCIISHFGYGAMAGGTRGHFGGVERQTTMLARWLAHRGHEVTLLTWDEGQAPELEIDDVLVMRMCRRDTGLPWARFFHPRWTSLARGMRRANAEVYYQNLGDYVTGQVALWCRLHRRPFVYSVASDPDCDAALPKLRSWRERLLYRRGVLDATRIIVQSRRQSEMLQSGFGRPSVVIPMPCPAPPLQPQAPRDTEVPRVVWVGRFSPVKRLDLLLEVAALLPSIRFEVAGARDANWPKSRALVERAAALPNVTVRGIVPRHQMPAFYRGAVALLCTSTHEGFPNTFLEAWSLGVPVVSTVEPDDLLSRGGLGFRAESAAQLAEGITRLASDRALWLEMSGNAQAYYRANHTVEATMPVFERVLQEAADERQGARRTQGG